MKLVETFGQAFTRDAGNGLLMVVGVFQLDPEIPLESISTAALKLDTDSTEDVTETSRGMGAGGMLTSPLWRVAPKP